MKKRKLKISIIPDGTEDIKVTRMFIVLIPIIVLILFSLSVYLITITIINIKNIKDYKSIKQLREETAVLTIKDRESKKMINNIEKKINNLKKTTKDIIPTYEYLSGIMNTEKRELYVPEDLDSIIMIVDYMLENYDSIYSILKNTSYAKKVPSLIPVNGWVLRKYGKVLDPYTETEKKSPGILLVAENNEPVYATADGYVVFAGQKKNLGKTVIIKHGQDFTTTYGHLSRIIINSGKSVKKGDKIGFVGKSGKTLSSSLYYEIKKNQNPINPEYSFLIPIYVLYDTLKTNL